MGEEDYAGLSDEANETAAQYLDKQGVDPKFYSQEFLEASELGDASSLRQRLAQMSADEKRELVKAVDQQGCTGLLLCAKKGDAEMVDVLLEAGAIVHDADNSGATSLHFAASRGSSSMIKTILSYHADFEAKDERHETPLMWARGREAVRLLVEAGADVNARNTRGETALMIASRNGDEESIEVFTALPGIDLDACDSQGCSAHAAAIAAGHLEAAELLVSRGAKPSAKPASRLIRCEEALLEAARRGDATAIEKFLQDGVDVEAEVAGETALLLAAGAASGRAVEKLLQGGADANHVDAFMGETPLMRAVLSAKESTKQLELLWMLLEAKADPNREDVSGRSAAAIAEAWGYKDAADILKAAQAGELSFGAMD
jgi:ankyrin repeat protein